VDRSATRRRHARGERHERIVLGRGGERGSDRHREHYEGTAQVIRLFAASHWAAATDPGDQSCAMPQLDPVPSDKLLQSCNRFVVGDTLEFDHGLNMPDVVEMIRAVMRQSILPRMKAIGSPPPTSSMRLMLNTLRSNPATSDLKLRT
jgi:hypothetical protein